MLNIIHALDDQFKYNWTEWDILLAIAYIPAIIVAYIINKYRGGD